MKKLAIQSAGRPDNFQTPKCAVDILIPYLKPESLIWECAWGKGNLCKWFEAEGFKVIGRDKGDLQVEVDFLYEPSSATVEPGVWTKGVNLAYETYMACCDYIITNPPYSLKDKFLARCYEIGKPFALLMPLTALEGKVRGALYAQHGIQLIIPNRRINFETPSGRGSGSWFQTAWFTWKLNLPKELNFVEMPK